MATSRSKILTLSVLLTGAVILLLVTHMLFFKLAGDELHSRQVSTSDVHSGTETITVLVLTSRSHKTQRDSIRQSWAKGHSNVYFVIGDRDCLIPPNYRTSPLVCMPDLQKRIPTLDILAWQAELRKIEGEINAELQQNRHDMWLVNMEESYRGLARKLKLAYERALIETKASWFLKVDDDTYVDVPLTTKILQDAKFGQNRFVANSFRPGAVLRAGKWAEHAFDEDIYPSYPHGAGHAITRDLATYVSLHKNSLFEYQGEDVSMGIWIHQGPLEVDFISSVAFEGHDGNCENASRAVIGHDISYEKMISCKHFRDIEGISRNVPILRASAR